MTAPRPLLPRLLWLLDPLLRWSWVFKLGLPITAFLVAATIYATTPVVGDRPLHPVLAVYSALSGFTMGPLVPPGPPTAPLHWLLWLALFAMPVSIAGSAVELFRRAVGRPELLVEGLAGHVIVCGHGALGRKIVEDLVALPWVRHVVVVDREPPPGDGHHRVGRCHVLFVKGDARDPLVLTSAGVRRAAHLVLATGDPMVNLTAAAASRLAKGAARLHVMVDTAEALLPFLSEIGLAPGDLVEQYRCAAVEVVARRAGPLLDADRGAEPLRVAIVGFGRFGRAFLAALRERAAGRALAVEVVDRSADVIVGLPPLPDGRAPLPTDALRWCSEVASRAAASPVFDLILIGLDDDLLGLRCAGLLRGSHQRSLLLLRSRALSAHGAATATMIDDVVSHAARAAIDRIEAARRAPAR